MKRTAKPKSPNTALWRARRRSGLERKRASWLLGHSNPDTIARYERGQTEPSLDNSIRLSLVYGCALEDLFPFKYAAFRRELAPRMASMQNRSVRSNNPGLFDRVSRCSYEELLDDTDHPAENYSPQVRGHVTRLAKRLAGL
jgi:transcriptional regulator with XRE-family HTH domain